MLDIALHLYLSSLSCCSFGKDFSIYADANSRSVYGGRCNTALEMSTGRHSELTLGWKAGRRGFGSPPWKQRSFSQGAPGEVAASLQTLSPQRKYWSYQIPGFLTRRTNSTPRDVWLVLVKEAKIEPRRVSLSAPFCAWENELQQ